MDDKFKEFDVLFSFYWVFYGWKVINKQLKQPEVYKDLPNDCISWIIN